MAFEPNQHLRKIKGQDYLDCKWRLVWLREEHPDACIETEMIWHDPDAKVACVRAVASIPSTGARATGHKIVSEKSFSFGYLEKAETQAVARALAMLGYGTQFAQELDEDETPADSAVESKDSDIHRQIVAAAREDKATAARPRETPPAPSAPPSKAEHTPVNAPPKGKSSAALEMDKLLHRRARKTGEDRVTYVNRIITENHIRMKLAGMAEEVTEGFLRTLNEEIDRIDAKRGQSIAAAGIEVIESVAYEPAQDSFDGFEGPASEDFTRLEAELRAVSPVDANAGQQYERICKVATQCRELCTITDDELATLIRPATELIALVTPY